MWYKKVWTIAFTFYTAYSVNAICGIKKYGIAFTFYTT